MYTPIARPPFGGSEGIPPYVNTRVTAVTFDYHAPITLGVYAPKWSLLGFMVTHTDCVHRRQRRRCLAVSLAARSLRSENTRPARWSLQCAGPGAGAFGRTQRRAARAKAANGSFLHTTPGSSLTRQCRVRPRRLSSALKHEDLRRPLTKHGHLHGTRLMCHGVLAKGDWHLSSLEQLLHLRSALW